LDLFPSARSRGIYFTIAYDRPFCDKSAIIFNDATVWKSHSVCALLFVVVLAISLFVAWLIYSRYKFCLSEDSLKIKRGVLNKEEVSIPYRQIQDVDIKRDISFQMMGLSRIVILTAGHEDEKPGEDDSEGILPALDKDLAEWLQTELLKRANVQKVTEEK
jgi:putative membrane protein